MFSKIIACTVYLLLASSAAAFSPSSFASRAVSSSQDRSSVLRRMSSQPPSMTPEAARARIKEMVTENKVLLFMKGNKMFPQCGFSNTAVQVMQAMECDFEVFDIFSDETIRSEVKVFSDWPTIPQLYVGGEFIGGTDIMIEMYKDGSLKKTLEDAGAEFH